MSTDNQFIASLMPYSIHLSSALSDDKQRTIMSLLQLLPDHIVHDVNLTDAATEPTQSVIEIKNWVDGRGLACPMPLLKTKVALRDIAGGESLYVVATDPNSQADITAFCQQTRQIGSPNQLLLTINQSTEMQQIDSSISQLSDTIFHFIITKTDSN